MGSTLVEIGDELAAWLSAQHVFFVATAPLAGDGHVNLSPKGLDTFRVLDPRSVAWLDLTGSGAETIAHLRENGRITLMFCAFDGPPRIVRLQGRGEAVLPGDARFAELRARFPSHDGVRSVIRVDVTRVAKSCGYGVPELGFVRERDRLRSWCAEKGTEGVAAFQRKHNARSIDGLPALPPD
ncbi:MAG: pyridoxamine 5'-phosphate oxidase family protein [Planctomycetes bacterium]|nr:pyridoxamine 5'-phosphate oxidase family protein [Planctomycetota bacterium]